jgi:rRNA-processing protein FCF1|tara:strand:+ start:703 stop:1086 length:384 start_codon:yes stop_codon:yes gene_type:complete
VKQILIDTCGWVAIIDSGMNIDTELLRVFGPAQMVLLESVRQELELLNNGRPRSKNLLLGLLDQKSKPIEALSLDSNHPDDQLFELAVEHTIPVLTVDVELKRRLYEHGLPILEVSKKQRLKLVDSL